jgi:TPR repeat protein
MISNNTKPSEIVFTEDFNAKSGEELYELATKAPEDSDEALKLYIQAGNKGHIGAIWELFFNLYIFERIDFRKLLNMDKIKESCRQAADENNVHAQTLLGYFHQYSDKLVPSCSYRTFRRTSGELAQAVHYYRLAADQGFADAQYFLGRALTSNAYLHTINPAECESIVSEAVKNFVSASNQGCKHSVFELGRIFENKSFATGHTRDVAKSIFFYRLYFFGQGNEEIQAVDSFSFGEVKKLLEFSMEKESSCT